MSRICPKCKAKLGGYDSFYCTACGEPLPTDLVNREGVFSRVANFATTSKDISTKDSSENITSSLKKFVNLKSIISSVVVLGIILGLFYAVRFGLGKYLSKPQDSTNESSSTTNTEYSKNVVEVPLMWEINTFGTDAILSYVPSDASIVIEGNDFSKFGSELSTIDPNYKDIATFVTTRSEQHFVIFAKEIDSNFVWSLIYFPIRADYAVSGDLVTKHSSLKFWKSDSIALITSNDAILSEVSDAKEQTIKNFMQTPIYASSRASSPKNGKLFIYVTSQKAKDYVKELQKLPKLSKEIQQVLESVNNSSSDYSIIL